MRASSAVHVGILSFLALALLALPAEAQDSNPEIPTTATHVHVGLHVLNFGNFEVNKGTYTVDLYIFFRWQVSDAPDGYSASSFEFLNGRGSRELLFDSTTDGQREVWYRVQASLYTEPHFENYPYDAQNIRILIEDSLYTSSQVVYMPDAEAITLDEEVIVAGWIVRSWTVAEATKDYPFGESYSRLELTLEVSRPVFSTTIRTFLPPFGFLVVSAFSFAFHKSKITQRISLGTSTLISAVAFHISQVVSLPALGRLTLFDQFMIAAYTFLAGSLVVTTMIAYDEDFVPGRDRTSRINRRGAVWTVAVAVAVFVVLRMMTG